MSMVTPWDLAKYFVFLQVALWYWLSYHILCLLSWFASPSPSNHFRHLKTRPYQFLFHPDSATAMWCIQRSNSKTPHVCLYLWQTWHRHKDKIHKTVETDEQNIKFHKSMCVLVVDTLTILPDFKITTKWKTCCSQQEKLLRKFQMYKASLLTGKVFQFGTEKWKLGGRVKNVYPFCTATGRSETKSKNGLILPTGQCYAPLAVNYSAYSAYPAYSA